MGTGYIDGDGILRDKLGRTRKPEKLGKQDRVLGKARKGRVFVGKYHPDMKLMMLDLARQGKSLTQIAVRLSDEFNAPIIADTIIGWEKTEGESYSKHLKLCRTFTQAYHEDILAKMISGEIQASNPQITAQVTKLKTLFADWGDKAQKIEISGMDGTSDKALEAKVVALMKRTGKLPQDIVKPKLKVVNGNQQQETEE